MKLEYGELKLAFDERTKELSVDGEVMRPSVRHLGELVNVLYDRQYAVRASPRLELYFIFRNASRRQHHAAFDTTGIRFDVTVLPGLHLGRELNKTAGHVHKIGPNGFSYPELYQVISGRAHYLLHRMKDGALDKVILVEAREGEEVLIQPGDWHVTINPIDEPLVMSNLVWEGLVTDYEPIRRNGGAAYFELGNGKLVPNRNYGRVPELTRIPAKRALKGTGVGPLYSRFLEDSEAFEFLRYPEKYQRMWRT